MRGCTLKLTGHFVPVMSALGIKFAEIVDEVKKERRNPEKLHDGLNTLCTAFPSFLLQLTMVLLGSLEGRGL